MKKVLTPSGLPTLADLEREVVTEYRELGRQALECRLQQLADQTGELSPLRQRKRRKLTLRTELGEVTLTVDYGQQPTTGQWHSPQQRAWGLTPHQKITPGLAEKLCFTALATTSYEQAAAVAACWGVPVDDAVIHQQVQRAGERADQQAEARVATSAETPVARPPASPTALVIMMDGRRLRQRGEHWGRLPATAAGARVAWQECKSAVSCRLQPAVKTQTGRGLLVEKFVVAYHGEPGEFGRRVQAEARRRGLGQVPQVFVVADGGVWLWRLVADRFADATGVLDFYHASQHLWALAQVRHPDQAAAARTWVEPLLHQLRPGGEAEVRQTLHDLPAWWAQRAQVLPPTAPTEIQCFENHREHIRYATQAARGCPIGSGAMESFCAQLQGRFKRGGQFWSEPGRRRLLALDIARRNADWSTVWQN